MNNKKKIGMISHHTDKRDIIEWVKYNEGSLKDTIIYATYETGHEIEDNTGLKVEKEAELKLGDDFSLKIKFKESKKGGDQEIGSLLVAKLLDYFIYFWDPLTIEPHDDEIKEVLRESVIYNIPSASNRNTADHLISSPFFDEKNKKYAKEVNAVEEDYHARIALVAHDAKKDEILKWVDQYKSILKNHTLFATGTTGKRINEETGLDVIRMQSGSKGGDTQISTLISNKGLDYLIFFWDPLTPQPHDVAVKSLLRNAVLYKIALACNPSTADHLITSNLFPRSIYTYGSK